jgi:hypothetical protein
MRALTQFFAAMLYGAAWFALLTNGLVLVTSLTAGVGPGSSLPTALLGLLIILYVHRRMGWPPFRRTP